MARVLQATRRDLDALLDLERSCYPPEQAYDRAEYVYALDRAKALNLKAVERGRVVGFGGAFIHDGWRAGHVYTLNVHPDARGRGLGRALMERLERGMRDAGMTRSVLEVSVANAAAIRLYESLGYARVARLPGYYATYAPRDAFRYVKALDVS